MKRNLVLAAMSGVVVVAGTSDAFASAFAVREDSSEAVSTLSAGAASAADSPSTVFDNPAGMTQLQGSQIEAGGVAVFPTINFHGSARTAGSATPGNDGSNGGRAALAPNFYGVMSLTDRLKAGVALNAPFGLMVKNNADWYGRYLGIDAAVMSANLNPALAYKVADKLSIGGGLSIQWFQATLSQAVNQSALGSGDALARFKGDDYGVGYNFGFLAGPWDATRIGLAYRSKVSHQLHGDLDFTNVAPALSGLLKSGAAIADVSLPASTTLGVTHDFSSRLSVSLGVQWTQWSTLKQIYILSSAAPSATSPVIEHFSNTWFTSLGGSYRLTDAWTLRGGVGWDQSPVSDQYRTVALPDNDRYMVGVGFGYKVNEALSLDGAYAHYFATPASMNGSINNTDNSALGATVLHGTYQLSLDYVSISMKYKF